MFNSREIMDHYLQSVHHMSIKDKKKRGSVPLVMMGRSVKRFTGSKDKGEKLGKAARVSGDVVRLRRNAS